MHSPGNQSALWGRLLLGLAAGIALYLACMALGRTDLPGCRTGSGCQDAMESRWASTFGIPVSFLGFVLYGSAFLLSWAFVRRERTLKSLQGGMAVSSVIAGTVWFAALQIFALQTVCLWCCAATGCAAAGALLLWRTRSVQPVPELDCSRDLRDANSPLSNDRIFRFTATGAGLTAVGLLALGSLSGPLHGTNENGTGVAENSLPPAVATRTSGPSIQIGRHHFNPDRFPSFGTPTPGAITAVLLNDYACSWCRQYCAALDNFAVTSRSPVRIILLPAARDSRAEDLQRTMLTLFHADERAWRSVSALLTSGQVEADPDAVGRAALQQLGADKWSAAAVAHSAEVDEQIQLASSIRQEARSTQGTDALPLLICGGRILSGAETDPVKLAEFLSAPAAANHPLPPPAPAIRILNPELSLSSTSGNPESFDIRLLNHGSAPLKVGWLELDDDCTVTGMPAKPVNPGETAVIAIRVAPSGTPKSVRRIRIHSDAPGEPVSVLLHEAARVASTNASR